MLGVSSEGKILARILLIFSANGPLPMYSSSIFYSRGVLLRWAMGISWMACATTSRSTRAVRSVSFINLIIIHTQRCQIQCYDAWLQLNLSGLKFWGNTKNIQRPRKIGSIQLLNIQIRLQFQTDHNNYTNNAKMRAFQSLINDLSLKNLIPALKTIESKPPLPFYVLKARCSSEEPAQNLGLSITRKLSNQTLSNHSGPFTIWSPYHLHRIAETKGNRPSNRIILKNPFKSQELLLEAMNLGVSEMVISSLQEYRKIESFKQRNSKFKNKFITYYWTIQNYPDSINEFLPIQSQIGGLFFPVQGSISRSGIDEITSKILRQGVRIQEVLCEGKASQQKELQQWKNTNLVWRDQTIQKTVDVCDWSQVENYILATRSLSRRRPVFNEQARELLKGLDPSVSTLLIECGQEQWLLGALDEFPIDQEKYLFDIEVTEETSRDTPRALSF